MRTLGAVLLSLTVLTGCAPRSAADREGPPKPVEPPKSAEPSAPRACTELACNDGLSVAMSPTSSWPHGVYRFTIEADEAKTICTGTLPLPDCGTRAISCEGDGAWVGESGCGLPEREHAFGDVRFSSTPAAVEITVALDERDIVTQAWTPTYETHSPNGPDCPPTCTKGSVRLDLAFD
jgi:hypothetical protein